MGPERSPGAKSRKLTNCWDKLKNEIKNRIEICAYVAARANTMMIEWGLLMRLLSTGIQGLMLYEHRMCFTLAFINILIRS